MKTEKEVRVLLASRLADNKCYPECKGWYVFRVDGADEVEAAQVQVCDECNSIAKSVDAPRLTDSDIMTLSEARRAQAGTRACIRRVIKRSQA